MKYLTVLIYIKKGKRRAFNNYEKMVLPLLKKHNCSLRLRLRIKERRNNSDTPDEIHIISYKRKGDFDKYMSDSERIKYSKLLSASVKKTILIEGKNIPGK